MSSSQVNDAGRIYRFGAFEVNSATGELRKSGLRIRLQEQPLQVLLLLLEQPGEVLSREDLRKKLWPADTFVDFDHSLNTAVNKLREALGDSASSPRYVETLARRGYRFLAKVELLHSRVAVESDVPEKPTAVARRELHPELEVPVADRRITRGLFGLIQVMYLCFYLAALSRFHEIEAITAHLRPEWLSEASFTAMLVTAGIGIPLRCYLLTAVAFDHQRLGEKFGRMFLAVLVLDQLWALAPFFLISKIGFGAAFAVAAALLYVPFSERTLVKMAYLKRSRSSVQAQNAATSPPK
jgi:cholera toxin transcriptional activator